MFEKNFGSTLGISGYFFKGSDNAELFRTCQALGLSGIDLWPWNFEAQEIQEFSKKLKKSELELVTFNIPGSVFRLGEALDSDIYSRVLKPLVDSSRELGCFELQMYCATPSVGEKEKGVNELIDAISKLFEMLPDEMAIVLENNLDQRGDDPNRCNPSRSPDALYKVVSNFMSSRISLCFDAANFVAVGVDPLVAFNQIKNLISVVHVKDCIEFKPEEHCDRREASLLFCDKNFGDFMPTIVGSGSLDWQVLYREVNDHFKNEINPPSLVIDPFIHVDLLDWWCIESVASFRQIQALVAVEPK